MNTLTPEQVRSACRRGKPPLGLRSIVRVSKKNMTRLMRSNNQIRRLTRYVERGTGSHSTRHEKIPSDKPGWRCYGMMNQYGSECRIAPFGTVQE